ncbi:hypothetical protein ACFYWY_08410 [Streptomyces sp. NPDC002870]|uniref:hypothetical protein n=1 Tax=Streptomyces sp. NPDC002870 TaxID=3364666 RepID=UPI0036899C61
MTVTGEQHRHRQTIETSTHNRDPRHYPNPRSARQGARVDEIGRGDTAGTCRRDDPTQTDAAAGTTMTVPRSLTCTPSCMILDSHAIAVVG